MPSLVRERRLHIRLNEEEYVALSAKASAAGMSISAFLRDHASKAFVRNRNDERRRLELVNRLNANLNMVAKWVNTYKSAADAIRVIVYLTDIRRDLDALMQKWEQSA